MLKIKKAQAEFHDVNVRRLLGQIEGEQRNCQQKLQSIQQIFNELEVIKSQGQLQLRLEDIKNDVGLLNLIQSVLGEDNWTLNPGLLGSEL